MSYIGRNYSSISDSSHFNSTIEVSEKKEPESKCSQIITYFRELRFIPGFRQFPGVKVCLVIAFLHKMHFYSVFMFLSNLEEVRPDNETHSIRMYDINHTLKNHHHFNSSKCSVLIPTTTHFPMENTKLVATVFMALVYILAPIPGFLADKYFSRHKTVLSCLLISVLGSLIQSVFHTYYEQLRMVQSDLPDPLYYIIHLSSIGMLIWGSTGVIALLVPLGVDQMEGAGEQTIKSYFNWHYWAGNLGGLLAPGGYFIYRASDAGKLKLLSGSYIATISIALALMICFFALCCNLLQKHKPVGSPIKKIATVIRSAAHGYRDERMAYDRKSLLDYAVGDSRGRHSFETVDDVKTFFRMVLVFGSMVWYFATYNLVTTVFPMQGQALTCLHSCFIASCFVVLTDGLAVFVTIPIIELLRRKYVSVRISKILYKFLIGVLLSMVAVYYAWITDMTGYFTGFTKCGGDSDDIPITQVFRQLSTMLPQIILIGVSESFAMVAAIEFVYAQSPHDMKGFLFGLLNLFIGIGFYLPNILYDLMKASSCDLVATSCQFCMVHESFCFLKTQTPSFMYYFVFAIISTAYAVFMCGVSMKYKRRQREPVSNWLAY